MIHVLVGAFWGDEGKGKVSDFYCTRGRALAARFQGGPNAGHTIFAGDLMVTTRMVPSGILNAELGLIGSGVVLNPRMLLDELAMLEQIAPGVGQKLYISASAHLITPEHLRQDQGQHSSVIGTTRMGVGPCYTDKYRRTGLRVEDIASGKLQAVEDVDFRRSCERLLEQVGDRVVDCPSFVNDALSRGLSIVAEGAQGTLLDIDHGDYPYVTSSNTFSGAVCTGLGVGPTKVSRVSVVVPVYMAKVGNGPFATKVGESDALTNIMKSIELDGATGKQRAYGWLDLKALRRSLTINGATDIIFTRTDLASLFPEICVQDGDELVRFEPWTFDRDEPSQLSAPLRRFIEFVEQRVGVPVRGISHGRNTSEYFEI